MFYDSWQLAFWCITTTLCSRRWHHVTILGLTHKTWLKDPQNPGHLVLL